MRSWRAMISLGQAARRGRCGLCSGPRTVGADGDAMNQLDEKRALEVLKDRTWMDVPTFPHQVGIQPVRRTYACLECKNRALRLAARVVWITSVSPSHAAVEYPFHEGVGFMGWAAECGPTAQRRSLAPLIRQCRMNYAFSSKPQGRPSPIASQDFAHSWTTVR